MASCYLNKTSEMSLRQQTCTKPSYQHCLLLYFAKSTNGILQWRAQRMSQTSCMAHREVTKYETYGLVWGWDLKERDKFVTV